MAYGLELCEPKVAFIDQERIDRLRMLPGLPAGCDSSACARRSRCRRMCAAMLTSWPGRRNRSSRLSTSCPDDDLQIMLFTSGSTGRSKGAVSTHRNVLLAACCHGSLISLAAFTTGLIERPPADAPQAASLLVIPLFHVTGLHSVALSCFRLQRRLVSMYKWDTEKSADIIDREGITNFTATPAITGDLVVFSRKTGRKFATLSAVGGGGAPARLSRSAPSTPCSRRRCPPPAGA